MKPVHVSPIIIEESSSIDDGMTPFCNIDSEIETITPMSDITPMSICTDDEIHDISFIDLVFDLSNINEELLLANYGYINKQKMRNILQGELFTANDIRGTSKRVMIKKIDKHLHEQQITIQNGIHFITDENIVTESSNLNYLKVLKCPYSNANTNIVKYVDSFESETHYYLVIDEITNAITMKDFIKQCHAYISENKLDLKKYNQIVKHIFYQLSLTLHWLHNTARCVHLNLCAENILLSNVFIMTTNGKELNKHVSVTITEFGCSQRFKNNVFKCNKYALSIDNEQYLAPNINNQIYDGRLADTWGLGMIFYEALIGNKPFDIMPDIHEFNNDEIMDISNGYWAIYTEKIEIYFKENNLMKYINRKDNTLSLLKGLLKINENERFETNQILNHDYFKSNYIYGENLH